MRKNFDVEPRLMALSEAELAAEREVRSWIPQSVARATMNPARWSQRSVRNSYWQSGVPAARRVMH